MIVVVAAAVAVVAAVRGVWSPCGLSMLSALNPMSETGRGHRFWVTVCWYVAGAIAGGAAFGAGCAVAAFAVGRANVAGWWTWALVLAGAAVAVLSDSAATRFGLPVHPRQVDERWLRRYRRWIYAGGFGVQIGSGFATYIMTAAVYLTALLAALTGRPAQALLVGLLFGAVRGLAILVAAPARSPERLRAVMSAVDRRDALSLRLVALLSSAVGGLAAWHLGGPFVAGGVTVALAAAALLPAGVASRARLVAPSGEPVAPSVG